MGIGHKFCGECGAPVQSDPQPNPSQGSSTVSVGDIGVMRGTIDASTNVHNTTSIGTQTNISGPVHIRMDTQNREPTASDLAKKARTALASGNYPAAHKLATQLTEAYPEESVGPYLRALAILKGRRPKILALDEAQTIERLLMSAIHLERQAHHLYCLALLRDDFYGANSLRMPSPNPAELVRQADAVPTDPQEVRFMLSQVPVPQTPLVLYVERRCH